MSKGFHVKPHEVMFFMAMKDGPAYGYELAGRFLKMTGGHIELSYGTLYPFLRRMEERGIIRSRRGGKSRRVYYELTKRGIEAQKRFAKRMKDCQKDMESKMLGVLSLYSEIFGRHALSDLLKRAM
jgi:DNA-binding PadR family transcriptional regulator